MDYMLNPMICIVWCSKAATDLFPAVPFGVFALGFCLLFTGLNLRGVEVSARFNAFLAAGMGVVIVAFLFAVAKYLVTHGVGRRGQHAHPPVLRSRALELGRGPHRDVDRGADVYRLRRHLDPVGGGGKSPPQHPARHRLHLPRHRHPVGGRGLRRPAGLARLRAVPQGGDRLRPHRHARRRLRPLHRHHGDPHRGQHRLGHRRPARGGAPALRHGAQRRPAPAILRRPQSQDPGPPQQRALRRRGGAGGGVRARRDRRVTTSGPSCSTSGPCWPSWA